MYMCAFVRVCEYMSLCVSVCLYVYMCVSTCVCMYVCLSVYLCVCESTKKALASEVEKINTALVPPNNA